METLLSNHSDMRKYFMLGHASVGVCCSGLRMFSAGRKFMRNHLSKQILSLQLTSQTQYGCPRQSVDKDVTASPG